MSAKLSRAEILSVVFAIQKRKIIDAKNEAMAKLVFERNISQVGINDLKLDKNFVEYYTKHYPGDSGILK